MLVFVVALRVQMHLPGVCGGPRLPLDCSISDPWMLVRWYLGALVGAYGSYISDIAQLCFSFLHIQNIHDMVPRRVCIVQCSSPSNKRRCMLQCPQILPTHSRHAAFVRPIRMLVSGCLCCFGRLCWCCGLWWYQGFVGGICFDDLTLDLANAVFGLENADLE